MISYPFLDIMKSNAECVLYRRIICAISYSQIIARHYDSVACTDSSSQAKTALPEINKTTSKNEVTKVYLFFSAATPHTLNSPRLFRLFHPAFS
mmetsp:Transcript_32054/g.46574  ORF Transcript_32054/g.46574 Transcript_32054/m.46574 type:complete len:94 (-) Transcript_32054:2967-3248(-)